MHQPNDNIKIIKLVNGDDIVCHLPTGDTQLPENGPLLRLVKPLQIKYIPQFTPDGFKDYIALTKWAAYTGDQVITIPKDKIMTVTNATAEMSRSWVQLSQNYHINPVRKADQSERIKFSNSDNEKINEIFDSFNDDEDDEPILH
jgi:hypothetical protein